MTLEMTLGMNESEANVTGYRGTDQCTQMKTDYGWSSDGNGRIQVAFQLWRLALASLQGLSLLPPGKALAGGVPRPMAPTHLTSAKLFL